MYRPATLLLCLLQLGYGSPLVPRAQCETIQIEPAQGCYQLAERCGITTEELIEFNPKDSLCTTLRIGQRVCCTAGDMPVIESNPDGSCKEAVVEKGMNCDKLAARCGISLPELHTFNNLTQTELCSSLFEGQRVCCTPGYLSRLGPGPRSDGSCVDYVVQPRDTCSTIAADFGLESWKELEEFNEGKAWQWRGCNSLIPDMAICVSDGTPPLPPPDSTAECGPRVPGTQKPDDGTRLDELNPCADGLCCSIWGYCQQDEESCG